MRTPPASPPDAAAPPPDTASPLVGSLSKWLIPSVGALFAVVGYVVTAAQKGLLGLDYDNGAGSYVASAADFVADLPTVVADNLLLALGGHPVPLGGHVGLLAAMAALCGAVALVRRLPLLREQAWARHPAVLPVAVLLLIAAKFLALDAPLSRVENVILGADRVERSAVAAEVAGRSFGRSFKERLLALDGRNLFEHRIRARTEVLWDEIVCSRIGPEAAQRLSDFRDSAVCQREQALNRDALTGEFLAHVLAGGLILLLAWRLLHASGPAPLRVSLFLLALSYQLTVPYAYGKLLKSTYFDYGWIRPAASLLDPEDKSGAGRRIYALVLARSPVGTNLLVVQRGRCAAADAEYASVRLSSVSASQVLSVEEIYRQDVITWTMLAERSCPPLPAPGEGLLGPAPGAKP